MVLLFYIFQQVWHATKIYPGCTWPSMSLLCGFEMGLLSRQESSLCLSMCEALLSLLSSPLPCLSGALWSGLWSRGLSWLLCGPSLLQPKEGSRERDREDGNLSLAIQSGESRDLPPGSPWPLKSSLPRPAFTRPSCLWWGCFGDSLLRSPWLCSSGKSSGGGVLWPSSSGPERR